ncbi:MAG: hypothetical protein ACK5YI_15595 [Rhodospirillales bacterium]|jgi:hypothetical protein
MVGMSPATPSPPPAASAATPAASPADEPDVCRLADLIKSTVAVELWCHAPGCGHHAVVDTAQLIRWFGAAMPVPEIARRFRCSACGGRKVHSRPAWGAEGPGVVARHTK